MGIHNLNHPNNQSNLEMLFKDSEYVNKKYLTYILSVHKKYLTDSGVPIEKEHIEEVYYMVVYHSRPPPLTCLFI